MQIRYTNSFNNNITINSKPSSLRLLDLEGRDGLENQISTTKTTNIDGIIVNSTTVGNRDLAIVGNIYSKNVSEIEKIKRDLISIFTIKEHGALYFKDTDDSKEYCIECIVSNAPKFTVNDYGIIKFRIELIAPIPFWTDALDAKVEIAQIKGSFHFPLIIPKTQGTILGYKQPSLIVNCNNQGDVNTGMRIEFYANNPVTNPSLFDVNTRKYIKINKSMVKDEKIIINTNVGKKSIVSIINGVETKILHLFDFSSDFLQIYKGDNLLRYNADSGIEFLTCNIYYSQKYLGV